MASMSICAVARPALRVAAPKRQVRAFAKHAVTFRTLKGEQVLEVDEAEYILDAAEQAGLELPYSCHAGGCSNCAAKVAHGAPLDQRDQSFLDATQISLGYAMLCVSRPTGNVTIETRQEHLTRLA
eukprot:scaffold19.g1756.t1